MAKQYMVSAVPHQGFDAHWRAGHRFGDAAVQVTVLDEDDPAGAPRPADRPAYTLTPAQFKQLQDDKRVRIEGAAAPAPADKPAPRK